MAMYVTCKQEKIKEQDCSHTKTVKKKILASKMYFLKTPKTSTEHFCHLHFVSNG